MKIEYIFNDEDREDIENWLKELENKKKLKVGDYISSGGLKLTYEQELSDGTKQFVIDREVGMIFRKKKGISGEKENV